MVFDKLPHVFNTGLGSWKSFIFSCAWQLYNINLVYIDLENNVNKFGLHKPQVVVTYVF